MRMVYLSKFIHIYLYLWQFMEFHTSLLREFLWELGPNVLDSQNASGGRGGRPTLAHSISLFKEMSCEVSMFSLENHVKICGLVCKGRTKTKIVSTNGGLKSHAGVKTCGMWRIRPMYTIGYPCALMTAQTKKHDKCHPNFDHTTYGDHSSY